MIPAGTYQSDYTGNKWIYYYLLLTADMPVGMLMEARTYTATVEGYRFGFNGMEQDNETYGDGNAYDFGARIYDSRLGRWMSVDPLQSKFASFSPYNFCINSPIFYTDPDGQDIAWFASKGVWKYRKALLQTSTGREVWQQMKKSNTRIQVVLTDKLLIMVPESGKGYGITEGFTASDEREVNSDGSFKKSTIFISTATYTLERNIQAGGTSLDDLEDYEANKLIQEELKTGAYQIAEIDVSTLKLKKSKVEGDEDYIPIGRAGGASSRPNRLSDETQEEYLQRVAGHEGVHGFNDGHAVKKWKNLNYDTKVGHKNVTGESLDKYLEKEPNSKEQEIINEQKSERVRRRNKEK